MSNIKDLILSLDSQLKYLSPVEWAEKNRVLTSDITNWPGPMDYGRTPYLKEIANSVMESDPGQIFAIKKGSQIGFSIGGIFTIMGWVISENPCNMLFMVNDDAGIKRAMQGPVDQMINSSGISHLIRATNVRGGRNQKTGDTVKGKTFPGGNLYTWSGQAVGSLSQISCKVIMADEFERYPKGDKNAGSLVSLIEERAKSYADSRKIYFISTPEIKQTSNIEPVYLKGDQRKYHIPCKCCGEYIHLEWQKEVDHLDGMAGVVFERDQRGKLKPETVKYRCQKCGGYFDQTHMYDIYDQDLGEWKATATPESPIYRSYHISALYAPAGMYNWKHYAQKWCEIYPKGGAVKVQELQTFWNQCLGETWEERGREVKVNQLLKNTRNYEVGVVPKALSIQDGNGDIILLTCAIDLNGYEDDARLDYEILGWSVSGSTYSIEHGSIGTFERSRAVRRSNLEKAIKADDERTKWTYRLNHPKNVWAEFEKNIMSKLYDCDNGRKMSIVLYGIDTGHFTIHAQSFVNKHQNCIALKGKSDNKFTKFDQIITSFKRSEKVPGLYLVEGDKVKDTLSELMTLVWSEDMETDQPEGFMNFPKPTSDKYTYKDYFHEYEGEKREIELNTRNASIGARWTKKHNSSPNHFWDVRVYNHVVKDVLVDMTCKEAKIPVNWTNFANLFK